MNQTEWDVMEKDFYNHLMCYFDDLYNSIFKLRESSNKYDDPYARSQLCIAFIAIDTFSRFNEIFSGVRAEALDKDNEKRFKKWVNGYVLNENNDIFKSHRTKLAINDDMFWKLRNSLLHFYSFPKLINGVKIGFVFNVPNEFSKKIELEMIKNDQKVKFIDLHFLIQAIFAGVPVFMKELSKKIENSPHEYIDSVRYAYEIVQNENMKTIKISK